MPRKKTPTKLKVAKGTHRPSVDGDPDLEPKPKVSQLKIPKYLKRHGRRVWREYAPALIDLQLLTEIDRDVFGLYCSTWDQYLDAEDVVIREGAFLEGKNGSYVNPAVHVRNTAAKQVIKMAAMFGMSPSDRSGMQMQIGGVADDDLSRRLG